MPAWATPEDAFSTMINAFAWRGTIRKRWGSRPMNTTIAEELQQYHTRLKIQYSSNLDAATGHLAGTWPGAVFKVGQMMLLEDGTNYVPFYVTTAGLADMLHESYVTPINGTDAAGNCFGVAPVTGHYGQSLVVNGTIFTIISEVPGPQPMGVSAGGTGTATFNVTTGAYVITGSHPNTDVHWNPYYGNFDTTTGDFILNGLPGMRVWFFPATPVLGFATYEHQGANNNQTFAFDRQFAYQYDTALGWTRLGTKTWTGTDQDYYSWCNWYDTHLYQDTLFVANNVEEDHIQFWNGTWHDLWPELGPGGEEAPHLDNCRILLIYKGRLFAINTIEDGQVYSNRIRWSWFGDPTHDDAWRSDLVKTAGYLDLPTKQAIVSASILNDRILLYCNNSTWQVVFTNNDIAPFQPHSINTDLGAHSQFSMVFLDKNCIGIGATGIHASNGNVVERIDNDIPDLIYRLYNQTDQTAYFYGVRDYQLETIYWSVNESIGAIADGEKFPNKILLYNYKNQSWAVFDDSITCFGHWEEQTLRTWASMDETWATSSARWYDPMLQKHPRLVIAGNQQGWTFLVDPTIGRNAQSLSISNYNNITNTFTVIDHNIRTETYVYISDCIGLNNINMSIRRVTAVDKDTLLLYPEPGSLPITGTYKGGGTLQLVSTIELATKPFNFYIKDNRGIAINKIACLVAQNPDGVITVGCMPSYGFINVITDAIANNAFYGTSKIPLYSTEVGYIPENQDSIWRTAYLNIQGNSVAIALYYSKDEMLDLATAFNGFVMEAMVIYAMPTTHNPID